MYNFLTKIFFIATMNGQERFDDMINGDSTINIGEEGGNKVIDNPLSELINVGNIGGMWFYIMLLLLGAVLIGIAAIDYSLSPQEEESSQKSKKIAESFKDWGIIFVIGLFVVSGALVGMMISFIEMLS